MQNTLLQQGVNAGWITLQQHIGHNFSFTPETLDFIPLILLIVSVSWFVKLTIDDLTDCE